MQTDPAKPEHSSSSVPWPCSGTRIQEGLRLMALAAIILRSIKSDEVKNVEPLVERLASKLGFTQEQFMIMVQEVLQSYVKDKGWGLVEKASGK